MTAPRSAPHHLRPAGPRAETAAPRPADDPTPLPASRHRCRCGHFPTDHMVVVPVGSTGNFRLDPVGPCAICGEGGCRKFSPGTG
jgi:hypothetical protein